MPKDSLQTSAFAAFGRYVNPPLAEFLSLSGRDQRFVRAEGCTLTTDAGDRYADWVAGYGSFNLGHNPPDLVAAAARHLASNAPNLFVESLNPFAGALARRLVEAAGSPFSTCLFFNSGTEAVEAAVKTAVAATRRRRVLYCEGAYHGTTSGSLSMMAGGVFRDRFEPLLPDFTAVPFDDLEALDRALDAAPAAAFVVEHVQVESGARALSPGFLAEASRLCRQHGALLVLDEVQTGMGRTGHLFAFQREGHAPDILVLGKSLGGGVVPLSAAVLGRDIFRRAYGDYGSCEIYASTFGGNALACHVGLQALSLLDSPDLLARVRERSLRLRAMLDDRVGTHPLVARVSLHGLLGAVTLRECDHPWFTWANLGLDGFDGFPVTAALLVHRLHRRKILAQVCGHDWASVRIEPPLVVDEGQCEEFVSALTSELDWIVANG